MLSRQTIELLAPRRRGPQADVQKMLAEAHQLEAIFSASYGTSRRNLKRREP
jgi:hypothetical protein